MDRLFSLRYFSGACKMWEVPAGQIEEVFNWWEKFIEG
jgi:hypothetical protein